MVDPESGQRLEEKGVEGALCLDTPWPGQARTVYGNHELFRNTYFSAYPGGCISPAMAADAGLPKTRSGKIMRRILRKIAAGEYDQLGDVSTLAEPEVVGALVDEHRARVT